MNLLILKCLKIDIDKISDAHRIMYYKEDERILYYLKPFDIYRNSTTRYTANILNNDESKKLLKNIQTANKTLNYNIITKDNTNLSIIHRILSKIIENDTLLNLFNIKLDTTNTKKYVNITNKTPNKNTK